MLRLITIIVTFSSPRYIVSPKLGSVSKFRHYSNKLFWGMIIYNEKFTDDHQTENRKKITESFLFLYRSTRDYYIYPGFKFRLKVQEIIIEKRPRNEGLLPSIRHV